MAKILVVGKYYPPFAGGMEEYTRNVCEYLAEDHEVTAVVFNHEKGHVEEIINQVRVIRCRTQAVWKSQPIALSMVRHIDLKGIDIVHFHAPNFFSNAILLLKLAFKRRRGGPQVIITHHTDVYGRRLLRALTIPLYRMLVRSSTAVVVTSLKNARVSKDLPGDARLKVIPLGVDTGLYSATFAVRAAAENWRRENFGDAPLIAFVGRHARFKGLDVLIRAVAMIPGARAVIAGNGPYRRRAEDLAAALGVADRIRFVGTITDVAKKIELLAAADVFVLPSTEITETFGISQLEAMAVGTPVIASDIPTGVTDVAIHEKTALLVEPGNPSGLASSIRLLLSDRSFATLLSEKAKEHVRGNFDQTHVLQRTRSLIEECLGRA